MLHNIYYAYFLQLYYNSNSVCQSFACKKLLQTTEISSINSVTCKKKKYVQLLSPNVINNMLFKLSFPTVHYNSNYRYDT